MSDLATQMENALARIRSVLGVRVILDTMEEVQEVHILTTEERNPKQVVRDAESTLLIKFSKRVDHRKIGVVQQAEADEKVPTGEQRLKIEALRLAPTSDGPYWEVVLSTPTGLSYTGSAAKGDPSSSLQAISTATLAAVNQYAGEERFRPEDVSQLTGDPPLVLVIILWLNGSVEEKLVGVARTGDDAQEATVKATLAALNRVLHRPGHQADTWP
ncbi:MAG: hypothetical protein NTV14_06700 [Coprothermobacterota bacterium]|nr:hypothetical protein [Coprothermobacterota bacterium]